MWEREQAINIYALKPARERVKRDHWLVKIFKMLYYLRIDYEEMRIAKEILESKERINEMSRKRGRRLTLIKERAKDQSKSASTEKEDPLC